MMLARAGLYYRTLRHVPMSQLFYYVLRRGLTFGVLSGQSIPNSNLNVKWLSLSEPLPPVEESIQHGRFFFLNQKGNSSPENPDWKSSGMPKLWRYHLHYFDWLRDENPDHSQCEFLIDHWIENNPVGGEDAWEPYTVSLRLMNWIRYCYRRRQGGLPVKSEWIRSIQKQGNWLSRNVEHHIRANHLLKNRFALAWFALFCCADTPSRQQLFHNLNLLQSELIEQFNPDGGHYERSPSYHSLCIELCIALYDALQAADINAPVFYTLQNVVEKGISYLRSMSFADGKVSLFGDSTLHGAHGAERLQNYWNQVSGSARTADSSTSDLLYLRDTGFVVWKKRDCKMIISVAGPSPGYQPGHAHCDAGSFELEIDGRRIIVDAGVSQYAAGPMRSYVRSSRAHNVLTIDDQDQNEIWGEFRIGARIVIDDVCVRNDGAVSVVTLSMRSHSACRTVYHHKREFRLSDHMVEIVDVYAFDESATVNSRLHFSPDFKGSSSDGIWSFVDASGACLSLEAKGFDEQSVESSFYCPDFGVVEENECLLLSRRGSSRGSVAIRILLQDKAEQAV